MILWVQGLGLLARLAPGPALVARTQRTLAPSPLQYLPDGRVAVRPEQLNTGVRGDMMMMMGVTCSVDSGGGFLELLLLEHLPHLSTLCPVDNAF